METEVFDKLIGELRSQVGDLSAAAQLLAPLVNEHGGERDTYCLAVINKDVYQLIRTIYHLELCGEDDHAFSPRPIDVAGLCRDIGRQTEAIAERLGVEFSWKLDKESIISLADGQLLERAILNMLTNAFAAAERGGWVRLCCGVDKVGQFKVSVSDSGKGLELSQTDESSLLKAAGGLGLGLAAARRVAALHGGKLLLENTWNAGVRSVLCLPIRKPEKGELLRQEKMPYDHSGGYSALLVEFSPLLDAECFLPEELE